MPFWMSIEVELMSPLALAVMSPILPNGCWSADLFRHSEQALALSLPKPFCVKVGRVQSVIAPLPRFRLRWPSLPAVGPLIGGWVDQSFGLRAVFLVLIIMSVSILVYTWSSLPETKRSDSPAGSNISSVVRRLITDARVWGFGFLIGATNGILFSYYAEAPFIFIQFFQMSPGRFGFFGIFVALSSILGAMLSKRMLTRLRAESILLVGTVTSLTGALGLTGFAFIGIQANLLHLGIMVTGVFVLLLGIGMTIPNCLSLALVHYGDVLGTAGAIFGLGYYLLVSLITTGMSILHNGSLVTMPLYFLALAIIMVVVSIRLARPDAG